MGNLPYHRALLWLYVEGHDEHHIRQQFDEVTLPLPDKDVLEEYQDLAAKLPLPPLSQKRVQQKKYEESDHRIFTKLGFEEIYLKSVERAPEEWEEVSRLLRNPVCRTAVDVGIICRYGVEDLSQVIPVTFQEKVTEAGLRLYHKYFFDHQRMSKADWRSYLKICAEIPYLYLRIHTALTKPKKEAMYLAGLPSKPAFTEFLKNVLATAEYKFDFYSRHNNKESDSQARSWAKVGFDAGVRYERFSSSDVTDFSKAVQTEFEAFKTDVPTISTDMLTEVKPEGIEGKTEVKAPVEPILFPDTEP
jgi:hypothetical protein